MEFKTLENAKQCIFKHPFFPITEKNENNAAMLSDAFRIFSPSRHMTKSKNPHYINSSFSSMQCSSKQLKMHNNTNSAIPF